MGIISNLFKRSNDPAYQDDPDSWLVHQYNGTLTSAGSYVNQDRSMGISAVYSCIKLVSWTIASLGIGLYKELDPTGKELSRNHPVHFLVSREPNPEQTSFEFFALMRISQMLWGAGIAEIEFDRRGVPIALWPIPTYMVRPIRTPVKNLLVYEVNIGGNPWRPDRKLGEVQYLWPEQVLVFPSLHSSRDCWSSPITLHRETLGLSIALREFGNKTFGQGTNPAGIISCDSPLGSEAEKDLISRLQEYKGLSNAHRLMYLNAGVRFEKVGLPPEDAQFLETQRYNVAEIARIYNVPLHLLGEQEKSTSWGSGIEEINQGFVTYTLNPYVVQQEQELRKKLLPHKSKHFFRVAVDKLLMGSLLDRYEAYGIARTHSIMTPNEIREREDLNPHPDGERLDMQSNMVNVKIADEVAMPPEQEKENDNGEDNEEDNEDNP